MAGGFAALRAALNVLENDFVPTVTTLGESQLGKWGCTRMDRKRALQIAYERISYSDGTRSLFEIAK